LAKIVYGVSGEGSAHCLITIVLGQKNIIVNESKLNRILIN